MEMWNKLCQDVGIGCAAIGLVVAWFQAIVGGFMLLGGATLLGFRLWLTWQEVQEQRKKKASELPPRLP